MFWEEGFNPTNEILTKSSFFNAETRKAWSNESKAFSVSYVNKNSSLMKKKSVISIISAINLSVLPINLLKTCGVCCGEIKLGMTF